MSIQLPDPRPPIPTKPPELFLINPTAVPFQFNIVLTGGTILQDSAGHPVVSPIAVNQQETNYFTIVGSPTGISSPPIHDNTYWMIY